MHKTYSNLMGFKLFYFSFDGGGSGTLDGDGEAANFKNFESEDFHFDGGRCENLYLTNCLTTFFEFDFYSP